MARLRVTYQQHYPLVLAKQGTQVEFFHTFNALYEAGKQIVITSRCRQGHPHGGSPSLQA